MKVPIAIVGNGAAAAEAVLSLRRAGYAGDIHVFTDNHHPPYNPMLGTYLVADDIRFERAFPFGGHEAFYDANRVTAHLGDPVMLLDAAEQTLVTADDTRYYYDHCLVASGARPSIPPVPGLREALAEPTDARCVFTMRSLADAMEVKAAVDGLVARQAEPGRAAVIGASLAGIKVAAALKQAGLAVALIEREPQILPLSAHPECAQVMEENLRKEGYELRLSANLIDVDLMGVAQELPGAQTGDGEDARWRARLSFAPGCEGAAQEDYDLVVVCTGSRPSLEFLTPGQVEVAEGIIVDSRSRSNIPTLYAAGDAAQGVNLVTGHHEIIGLWSSARYQGRAAGRSLAGAPGEYRGTVPHNITHVGCALFASLGCMRDYDTMKVDRDEEGLQVRVWREGRLAGVNLLNQCATAGVTKQTVLKRAMSGISDMEATWTSFKE